MKFRTELHIGKNNHSISHSEHSIGVGSCFVENICSKLKEQKFSIEVNPFGIIFNPYSIAKILNNSLSKPSNLEKECIVLEQNGIYRSYDYHSKFNSASYNEFIAKTDKIKADLKDNLKSTNNLFITFGTAWVYRLIESNQIVANCQKEPQSKFIKTLLDLDEITEVYVKIFKTIIKQNPKIKIILTVSPVRHIKDGIIENNQSKSILLLLCKALSDDFKKNVIYFPSYEIQMDDLRDYRFYNSDLVHPNQMAIDYIYDKFSTHFFLNETIELNKKIDKLFKLENHKYLNATVEQKITHQEKIEKLKNELNFNT